MMRGLPYDESIDIFSFGIVLWELLVLAHPYAGVPDRHLTYLVLVKGLRPAVPSDTPRAYADLMAACWAEEPRARPTAAEVVAALQRMDARVMEAEAAMLSGPWVGGSGGGGFGASPLTRSGSGRGGAAAGADGASSAIWY